MYKITEKFRRKIKPLVLRSLPCITRPVFILSAPRSGSTHLYEVLRRCNSIASLDHENDSFWWSFFPYSRLDTPNDFISAQEINAEISAQIRPALALHVARNMFREDFFGFLKLGLFGKEMSYLEKTVANCFHLEALAVLFPDARYIHLVRDGRATVSSMMEGWTSGHFMQRKLSIPPGSGINYWTFPVPPGWDSITHYPLNEICAWSWIQHNEHVLNFFDHNSEMKKNLIRVSYEELTSNTLTTINSLIKFCEFETSSRLDSYLHKGQISRTTISAPAPMKWKRDNYGEIKKIEGLITPMMARLGYSDLHVRGSTPGQPAS